MKKLPVVTLILSMLLFINACGINSSDESENRVTTVDSTQSDSTEVLANTKNKVPGIEEMKQHNGEIAACVSKYSQSPVNVTTPGKKAKHKVEFKYVSSHEVVKNLGHTVELMYDKGSAIVFDEKKYQLVQFHFHTPSEHKIDTEHYPMEVHLVHQGVDSTYLVVSLLFEEKKENLFLKNFIADIPKETGDSTETKKEIDLTRLFPGDKRFYTYKGSLTTPPYTEGVRWLIFRQSVGCSKEQIAAFKKIEGFNARKLQPMNARMLEEF